MFMDGMLILYAQDIIKNKVLTISILNSSIGRLRVLYSNVTVSTGYES